MEGLPFQLLREGITYGARLRPQPVNHLGLELDTWERRWPDDPADEPPLIADEQRRFLKIAETIARLAPTLASLDRTQCRADLFISTIRHEDWGGFDLPAEFVRGPITAFLRRCQTFRIGIQAPMCSGSLVHHSDRNIWYRCVA